MAYSPNKYNFIGFYHKSGIQIKSRDENGRFEYYIHISEDRNGRNSVSNGVFSNKADDWVIKLHHVVYHDEFRASLEHIYSMEIEPEGEAWKFRMSLTREDFDELKSALRETELTYKVILLKDPELKLTGGVILPRISSYDEVEGWG